MTRVAPVKLKNNHRTLWFDPGEVEVRKGDAVVVSTARGIELGKKEKLLMRLKNSVNILLPLILSSLQRIDVISSAMELRGFGKDKKKRTWYMKRPMKRNDFIAIALGALLLAFSLGMIAANGGRFWNPFAQ